MVREHTFYDLNLFKFVEICFISQKDHFDKYKYEYYICPERNATSVTVFKNKFCESVDYPAYKKR